MASTDFYLNLFSRGSYFQMAGYNKNNGSFYRFYVNPVQLVHFNWQQFGQGQFIDLQLYQLLSIILFLSIDYLKMRYCLIVGGGLYPRKKRMFIFQRKYPFGSPPSPIYWLKMFVCIQAGVSRIELNIRCRYCVEAKTITKITMPISFVLLFTQNLYFRPK